MSRVLLYVGDVRKRLRQLPDESVHAMATSPPYYKLRDYDHEEQIGLEETPQEYVDTLVEVFHEARRVLRSDGTLWLNLGDSYAGAAGGSQGINGYMADRAVSVSRSNTVPDKRGDGLKPKDLIGIPWRVALALQADGWWLRSDCVWSKNSCMPESVTDRPTRQHEYVFLLAKSERYFFDMEAVRESDAGYTQQRTDTPQDRARSFRYGEARRQNAAPAPRERGAGVWTPDGKRNMRTVWTINPQPFHGAHFATFPPALVERCIKASTSEYGACASCGAQYERIVERGEPDAEQQRACGGDANGEYHGKSTKGHADAGVQDASAVKARILAGMRERRTIGWEKPCKCRTDDVVPSRVLDPFGGAGTTALVGARLGRDCVLIELNPEYADMAAKRVADDAPMFNQVEVIRD